MTAALRCYLPALGVINALGSGRDEVCRGLLAGDSSGMVLEAGWLQEGEARVGRARGELPEIPPAFARYRCRNNQLLLAALAQIMPALDAATKRYGRARIGVVLGGSTAGIDEGEAAMRALHKGEPPPPGFDYAQQEIGMPAVFLARYLGLPGPAFTVSTACTSSAKAFASARNLLRLDICDAVIVGGVDSLCRLTVSGFTALELTTSTLCNPMSRNRRGINIGEGAALFLLTREPAAVELLGIGESSDAYHISAPSPDGTGAEAAMRAALADAGIAAEAVAYVKLHATATLKNDEMESLAVARTLPAGMPCSGTKPLTGHALGAAGAIELAFCWLALTDGNGHLPPHVWDGAADPALPALALVAAGQRFAHDRERICMSNSFAFGGSNVSVLIGDSR
ncbi:MAG: beta-ketoacyl-ACP synthase [Betaproteobacteria bacterium]|nr:beta-ketoacyl-ACP synthase [Betaproteobacteria bacterium]